MEKKFKIISLKEEDEKNQNDTNFCLPTPKTKGKKMAIPDFSPIIMKETNFGFKTNGSYKRQKIQEPESLYKNVCKNYTTPSKIQGRDLFGSKIGKSHRRKLNFNDEEELEKIQKPLKVIPKINKDFRSNLFGQFFNNDINIKDPNRDPLLKQNKMDNEFIILKTLKKNKLDFVYKVEEKNSQKIYCIKKINKNSAKNNINNTFKLFNDMKNKSSLIILLLKMHQIMKA